MSLSKSETNYVGIPLGHVSLSSQCQNANRCQSVCLFVMSGEVSRFYRITL